MPSHPLCNAKAYYATVKSNATRPQGLDPLIVVPQAQKWGAGSWNFDCILERQHLHQMWLIATSLFIVLANRPESTAVEIQRHWKLTHEIFSWEINHIQCWEGAHRTLQNVAADAERLCMQEEAKEHQHICSKQVDWNSNLNITSELAARL